MRKVKRRKEEERGSSHNRLSPPYNTLQKIIYNIDRSCRLWLHSLSEYSSKQENEKKRKRKRQTRGGVELATGESEGESSGAPVPDIDSWGTDRLGRLSGKGRAISFGVCNH
jgi:hypothetical protein